MGMGLVALQSSCMYYYLQGTALGQWGELLILWFGQVAVVGSYWALEPGVARSCRLAASFSGFLLCAALLLVDAEVGLPSALGIVTIVFGNVGKLLQIYKNWKQRSTGVMSPIPVL